MANAREMQRVMCVCFELFNLLLTQLSFHSDCICAHMCVCISVSACLYLCLHVCTCVFMPVFGVSASVVTTHGVREKLGGMRNVPDRQRQNVLSQVDNDLQEAAQSVCTCALCGWLLIFCFFLSLVKYIVIFESQLTDSRCLPLAVCLLLSASCCLPLAACLLLPASCCLPLAVCLP
jgi:hypothetical protein